MKWQDVTNREKVYEMNKQDPNCLPDVSMLPPNEAQDTIDDLEFKRMIRAINTEEDGTVWEPDYRSNTPVNNFPWFDVQADDERPGGFALSGAISDDWGTVTLCGSRFAFKTPERFFHAWKHFPDQFTKHYLILKK